MTVYAADFVKVLLSQVGDPYIYGYEVNLNDPNPPAFDCSEFMEWGAHRVGLYLPDGSTAQFLYCRDHGLAVSIEKAIATPGALLFRGYNGSEHVACSLGNGETVEAKGRAYGVVRTTAYGRDWNCAALIPDLDYSVAPPPIVPVPVQVTKEDDEQMIAKLYQVVAPDGTLLAPQYAVAPGFFRQIPSREERDVCVKKGLYALSYAGQPTFDLVHGETIKVNQREFDVLKTAALGSA